MKVLNVTREYIFEDDRAFQSAHASTLIELDTGEVLAAWFGGSRENHPDVAIWMARRSENGWSKPWIAADTRNIALWNPVLFKRPDGRILLFYKEGKRIPEWRTMIKYSDDNGHTFSESAELVKGDIGGRGPVKNKPILISNGDLLAPASLEGEQWDSFVDISSDGGKTWTQSALIPVRRVCYDFVDLVYDPRHCFGKGIIQPTLWESEPNHIHALMRSTSSAIFRSDSTDGGKTWCCAYDSGLPNNNSGIDAVKLPNGKLVLAWNPVSNLPNYYKGPRTPLILSYSEDNGATWNELLMLESERGGFAYPSIIANEHEILLTYTWNRERIVFCKVEYSDR